VESAVAHPTTVEGIPAPRLSTLAHIDYYLATTVRDLAKRRCGKLSGHDVRHDFDMSNYHTNTMVCSVVGHYHTSLS
jgi:hypothetical protein